tara:strand:- start:255 stop:440 length:186 start_codon:yes stop_codon:yes gene_type:complete
MSHDGHEQWLESEKNSFADDHPELIEDSDEFIEKFTEYLKDNDPKNEPTLSAYQRSPSLAD